MAKLKDFIWFIPIRDFVRYADKHGLGKVGEVFDDLTRQAPEMPEDNFQDWLWKKIKNI